MFVSMVVGIGVDVGTLVRTASDRAPLHATEIMRRATITIYEAMFLIAKH
jgi:hypothetical protein